MKKTLPAILALAIVFLSFSCKTIKSTEPEDISVDELEIETLESEETEGTKKKKQKPRKQIQRKQKQKPTIQKQKLLMFIPMTIFLTLYSLLYRLSIHRTTPVKKLILKI